MKTLRAFAIALVLSWLLPPQAFAGSGTVTGKDASGTTRTFDVTIDGSGNYVPQQVICDAAAAAQCETVKAASTAAATTDPSFVVQTSPNDPVLGAPGATACASDTAPCNQNQQMQRLAQRITSTISALGSPFQVGGSIGNTGFNALQSGSANAVGNPFYFSNSQGGNTQAIKAASAAAAQSDPAGVVRNPDIGTPTASNACAGGTSSCTVLQELAGILTAMQTSVPLGTTGGWTPVVKPALSTTVVAIKPSGSGWLGKAQCDGINTALAYLELFNVAPGSVILGTTAYLDAVPLQPGLNSGFVLDTIGEQFGTAISAAVVSTLGGSTATGTPPNCAFAYN